MCDLWLNGRVLLPPLLNPLGNHVKSVSRKLGGKERERMVFLRSLEEYQKFVLSKRTSQYHDPCHNNAKVMKNNQKNFLYGQKRQGKLAYNIIVHRNLRERPRWVIKTPIIGYHKSSTHMQKIK